MPMSQARQAYTTHPSFPFSDSSTRLVHTVHTTERCPAGVDGASGGVNVFGREGLEPFHSEAHHCFTCLFVFSRGVAFEIQRRLGVGLGGGGVPGVPSGGV